jgi:streptomycin 6-kinase
MLSNQFRKFICAVHGDEGAAWLEALPNIISACEHQWSLRVEAPFDNLSYNYIAPTMGVNGDHGILKISFPNQEFTYETEALKFYDGRGCIKLLAADQNLSAMLLERIKPGTQLLDISDDEQATHIAAQVMKELWQPAPSRHPFPTVAGWAQGLERLRQRYAGGTGPLPSDLVNRAESLFKELLMSMDKIVLLHGDLHHENILRSERGGWLAIDPKGVVGEPAYEVGALLRNTKPQLLNSTPVHQILARRLDILANKLGFERERMLAWGFAQAVLAAWWCLEENLDCWTWFIYCAEQIDGILPR